MPTDTFFKLDPVKQKRVYDASMNEFCRVPYEQVSIKNIVNDAAIARGSFYQYFTDKEDLFIHLLHSIRSDMEEDMEPGDSIFQFIYSMAEKEIRAINSNRSSLPVKSQLIRQMAISQAALNIFEKDINRSLKSDERMKKVIEESGLAELEESKLTALQEMLSQSLRHAVIQVISADLSPEDALHILKMKLTILKKGIF